MRNARSTASVELKRFDTKTRSTRTKRVPIWQTTQTSPTFIVAGAAIRLDKIVVAEAYLALAPMTEAEVSRGP